MRALLSLQQARDVTAQVTAASEATAAFKSGTLAGGGESELRCTRIRCFIGVQHGFAESFLVAAILRNASHKRLETLITMQRPSTPLVDKENASVTSGAGKTAAASKSASTIAKNVTSHVSSVSGAAKATAHTRVGYCLWVVFDFVWALTEPSSPGETR